VRVNDWEADTPFRYLRFRDPPYSENELEGLAARIQSLLAGGFDVYAYVCHEDAPTAPEHAERLLRLVNASFAATMPPFIRSERVPGVPNTSLTVRDQR